MSLSIKREFGFTLAEVLITLTIIGVIAAIAVPSLIIDIKDQQYKAAWKKAYADLSQATIRVLDAHANNIKAKCADNDHNCFKNLYAPYLAKLKTCDNAVTEGCWHAANTFKYMDGSDASWSGAGLVLKNGSMVLFGNTRYDCNDLQGSINRCGNINIDINGVSGPNIVGKDIFGVHVLQDNLRPYGTQGDDLETTCSTSALGFGCSAVYLYQ